MESILLSWSGGKDCAMALYEFKKAKIYKVKALLTTVTQSYDRISMHGVRRTLLEKQAESLGLPLEIVFISNKVTNEEYEQNMAEVLKKHQKNGVHKVAFGDIYLDDLRKYRQEKLSAVNMEAVFPIWKRETKELAQSLCTLGFKSIITCVDTKVLNKKYVGKIIDKEFISELPSSIDSCGENGEYHSFVFDGPIFRERINFELGEKVLRDNRFYYCDLIPNNQAK